MNQISTSLAVKKSNAPINKQTIIWALALIGIAAVSYILLTQNMRVSLVPHVRFFAYVCGINFTFVEGTGYVAAGGAFAITDGCIGAKLFVSMFLLVGLGFPPQNSFKNRALFTVRAYFAAMACALAVSILRIAVSLPMLGSPSAQLAHNILSIFFYFGSLIAAFLFMQNKIQKQNSEVPHEAN